MKGFDVAVVGGGPAGAATALGLASSGLSVALFECARARGPAVGEVLSPEAGGLLAQLGVHATLLASGARPAHGVWSAWGGATVVARDFVADAHGPAWRVDRREFDELLLAAARRAGAEVLLGSRPASVARDGSDWRISSGRRPPLRARFVVDATGRAATVARHDGARWVGHDRLIALDGVLEPRVDVEVRADDVLLLESVPQGWWYSVVSPSGRLVAAFLADSDLVHSRAPRDVWSDALTAAPLTASRVAGFKRCAIRVRMAAVGHLDRAAGRDWLAVGDAASTVDPLSGKGVSKALRDAILATRVVIDALSGRRDALDTHADRVRADYEASLAVGAKYYGQERRWPAQPFWQRRSN